MKSELKQLVAFVLLTSSLFIYLYLYLWAETFHFISEKIGLFFTIILFILTNIIEPGVYVIWKWIDGDFPTGFFFIWLGTGILLLLCTVLLTSRE